MNLPKLYRLRQKFDAECIGDIPSTVSSEIQSLGLQEKCEPGQSVAITAGSRGIANIPLILRSIASELKSLGLEPFIVPAMGSHGGGKAEGQEKVLKKYGITEETTGAPVRACMDVVEVGKTGDGVPVVFDRLAREADWSVVVNRVKPHTKFTGAIESGLCKMILIGLGKAEGAKIYHRAEVHHSFEGVAETAV
ncbi:MAG: lactate racemase domain-containing protein, partial [Planctomycetota bacterium]|nr:lactate racemase domain-containing protein [Planctomycetota bacterium]